MNLDEITKKADVLIEALPYVRRFGGSVFVVKYGGAFMDDPNPKIRERVARDISFLAAVGIKVVVVHGGGKAISRWGLRRLWASPPWGARAACW